MASTLPGESPNTASARETLGRLLEEFPRIWHPLPPSGTSLPRDPHRYDERSVQFLGPEAPEPAEAFGIDNWEGRKNPRFTGKRAAGGVVLPPKTKSIQAGGGAKRSGEKIGEASGSGVSRMPSGRIRKKKVRADGLQLKQGQQARSVMPPAPKGGWKCPRCEARAQGLSWQECHKKGAHTHKPGCFKYEEKINKGDAGKLPAPPPRLKRKFPASVVGGKSPTEAKTARLDDSSRKKTHQVEKESAPVVDPPLLDPQGGEEKPSPEDKRPISPPPKQSDSPPRPSTPRAQTPSIAPVEGDMGVVDEERDEEVKLIPTKSLEQKPELRHRKRVRRAVPSEQASVGGFRSTTRVKDWYDKIKSTGPRPQDIPGWDGISDHDLDIGLMKLHVNMGHAPPTEMAKLLRLGKARARAIDRCRTFTCDECERIKEPRVSRPVKMRRTREFGQVLGLDLIELALADESRITGVNMVDEYTSYQVVWPINSPMSSITSEDVLLTYELGWASWADDPTEFAVDQGRHFLGHFSAMSRACGIPLVPVSGSAHFQAGHPEAHGKVWKTAFEKESSRLGWSQKSFNEVLRGFAGINKSHNRRHTTRGYSPQQWVLGRGLQIPHSLLENSDNLPVQQTLLDDKAAFQHRLGILEGCDRAFLEADSDARIRRAMLMQRRPSRGPFVPGAQVYIWRKRHAHRHDRERCWIGPGHVLCGQGSAIWVEAQGSLFKCAAEQLRHATSVELRACQEVAAELVLRSKKLADPSQKAVYKDVQREWMAGELQPPQDGREEGQEERPFREGPTGGGNSPAAESGPAVDETAAPMEAAPPAEPVPVEESRVVRAISFSPKTDVREFVAGDGVVQESVQDRVVDTSGGISHQIASMEIEPSATHAGGPPASEKEVLLGEGKTAAPSLSHYDQEAPKDSAQTSPFFPSPDLSGAQRRHAFLISRSHPMKSRLHFRRHPAYSSVFFARQGCLLTRKNIKKNAELSFKLMDPETQQAYRDAMMKEWEGWMSLNAVEVVSAEEASKVPRHQIIPTRFVLTDKNEGARTPQNPDLAILPKARLVILGNLERDLWRVRTDAPTISELAPHLVFQYAASWRTPLEQGDITQAFLNSSPLERSLYLTPPREGLPGVRPGELLRPLVTPYGLADAPRAWWKQLDGILTRCGWRESKIERGLYLLHRQGKLVGIGGTHVDDWVSTGRGPVYEAALKKLQASVTWGKWHTDSFTHCGRDVSRDSQGAVVVGQIKFAANLTPIQMTTNRHKVPPTDDELEQARSALGGLSWLAKQSRPDLSFDVSRLLADITKGSRKALQEINETIERAQKSPLELRFPPGLDMDQCLVGCFSDASWGNRSDGSSQAGYIHCLMGPDALKDRETPLAILAWSSHKIRRVCRSTLSAEAQGLCIGVEGADYIKVLLAECRNREFSLPNYRQALKDVKGVAIIDARSVYDYVQRDSGKLPSDKRLGIDLRLLQYYLQTSDYTLRWVAGQQQLADCLTKTGGDHRYFHWVAAAGRYQLVKDEKLESRVKNTLEKWQYEALDETDLRIGTEPEAEPPPKAPPTTAEGKAKEERRRERIKRKNESQKRRTEQIRKHTVARLAEDPKSGILDTFGAAKNTVLVLFTLNSCTG